MLQLDVLHWHCKVSRSTCQRIVNAAHSKLYRNVIDSILSVCRCRGNDEEFEEGSIRPGVQTTVIIRRSTEVGGYVWYEEDSQYAYE